MTRAVVLVRLLVAVAVITFVAASCSSATTRITAEEPDPTALVETPLPTTIPTATPELAAPTSEPAPTPTATAARAEPESTGLMPSGEDDSEAIQDLLNTIDDGAELRLGAGRFQIESTLVVRLDVQIVGAGSDATILERSDDGALVNARNVDVWLQDIGLVSTFETDDDSRVPLLEVIGSEVSIAGVAVDGGPGTGAWIEDSTGTVENSIFANNGWIGLWVVGDSDLTITNSAAQGNGDGFLFDGSSAIQLTGNTATMNVGAGFWWHADSIGLAEANTAAQNDLGFLIDGDAAPELVGNTATENVEIGFAFRESSSPLVDSNEAVDSTQGFYIDGDAAPTLINNTATDNVEVGMAWYDDSAGSASGTTFENNGQPTFVEETASPTIDGEVVDTPPSPLAEPAEAPAEVTTAPDCPVSYSLEGSQCVRVVGSVQAACSTGTLQGGSCVVQTEATPEQTCAAPYLLYRAESGDPTLPGLDGTCAWFDNGGICPAGDIYNPDAGNGEIFTHKCKRPSMVTYTCAAGTLAGDVCESREPPITTCASGTIRGSDCIDTLDPS